MADLPYILDNLDAETRHARGLELLLEEYGAKHGLAIATGYVNLDGLHEVAVLNDGRSTRLMIGATPDAGLGANLATIDAFDLQLAALRDERDFSRFPPSRAARRLEAVEAWLEQPDVEVRRYTQRFLHGKAYMLGDADSPRAALVTSANLTGAGLNGNLELGLTSYGPPAAGEALEWFDRLWDEAQDFKGELLGLLFPVPPPVDPRDVYLRALLELHRPTGEGEGADRVTQPELELAPFQRDGYERARAIVATHGGVIYADGVGTGKTEIGLTFIEERTREDGVYALVVTPAQLKQRWQERILEAKLSARVVSFNELATDEQLAPDAPDARKRLELKKDSYRIVVVDEGHALRNEDTRWHRAMERLLGGTPKQVVLLTATPINNGLWDLYNMVMLFARHDRGMTSVGIDSIRDLFLKAGANQRDPEELDPSVLYPLANAISVRRDRRFIEANYEDASFPDGTPIRFPTPKLATERYDLDAGHGDLFERITDEIEDLTMARYRPTAYEIGGEEAEVEAKLGGLLRSGVLKRFESCWAACLRTCERMIASHEAFLAAWDQGEVLSGEELREAAGASEEGGGLAGWVEEVLAEEGRGARPVGGFEDAFREDVAADLERLRRIESALGELDPEGDPKLAKLRQLLEGSPAQKVAVFATFGDTVRYLDEHLPADIGGRERIAIIGGETSPDERLEGLARFTPKTIVRDDYEPPAGEVDLLISTDVLSEGQNLQQAQAVISYDMPWNPQRVVQRNGRVVRLVSPHEEVYLTTMLPEAGELDRLLGLEAAIQAKIKAAGGVYGMETEVIEGMASELRSFAERLEAGDPTLVDESEDASGAFAGEEIRRMLDRAFAEGELERIEALPWGIGACFRQTAAGRSQGAPGVFFATRTTAMPDNAAGYPYWRYVEIEGGVPKPEAEPLAAELEILRRIDPAGSQTTELEGVDLEAAWSVAAKSIVAEHAERTDLRAAEESIGPKQSWALDLLRDPTVALPSVERAGRAAEALTAARSSAVRRRLGEIQERLAAGELGREDAAGEIIATVDEFGLRPVVPPPIPTEITVDELGVVCWMVVLGG